MDGEDIEGPMYGDTYVLPRALVQVIGAIGPDLDGAYNALLQTGKLLRSVHSGHTR
ncbi:MAG: hypothetical protein GWP91_25385 [Rhodobacterales bacterium]|nr:hypothetical protein [Rhodobacterales bacterium]